MNNFQAIKCDVIRSLLTRCRLLCEDLEDNMDQGIGRYYLIKSQQQRGSSFQNFQGRITPEPRYKAHALGPRMFSPPPIF